MRSVLVMATIVLSGCMAQDIADPAGEEDSVGDWQGGRPSVSTAMETGFPWHFSLRIANPTGHAIYAHGWGCGSHVSARVHNDTHGFSSSGAYPGVACGQAMADTVAENATHLAQWSWNGTLIDHENRTYVAAPPGWYEVSLSAKWQERREAPAYLHHSHATVWWPGQP